MRYLPWFEQLLLYKVWILAIYSFGYINAQTMNVDMYVILHTDMSMVAPEGICIIEYKCSFAINKDIFLQYVLLMPRRAIITNQSI